MKVNITGATVSGQVYIKTLKDGNVGCNLDALNGLSCDLAGITGDDTATIRIENTSGVFSGYSEDDGVCSDNEKTCSIKMNADKTITITFEN